MDVDGDLWIRRIVYVADKLFGDDRYAVLFFVKCARDFPLNFRRNFGHAAINFAVEIFDDFRPSLEVLKRVKREPNKIIDLPGELLAEYELVEQQHKTAEKLRKDMQARIIAALGDAEGARIGGNGAMFTYLETHRKAYSVEATTYRTLRLVKQKGAKS